jgi:nucleoside-diphosphate-sugar epimerase
MNVLITGASGFVGQATISALVDRGATVIATSTSEKIKTFRQDVEWVTWDASLTDCPGNTDYSKLDAIVHLASPRNRKQFPQSSHETYRTNITSTLELARRAAENNAQFVFTSTGDVFGEGPELVKEDERCYSPPSFYAATKASAELLLRPYSALTNIVILRVFHPYGLGGEAFLINRLVERIITEMPIQIERDGGILVNPVWIGDLADGICKTIERRVAGTYNLAGNEVVRLVDLIKLIAELVQKSARVNTGKMVPPGGHAGQIDKARADFEYSPRTDLRSGLQHLIDGRNAV